MYKAKVNVTLRPSILDPKGKATHQALQNLGLNEIQQVRIGKYMELELNATSEADARQIAEAACVKLLANEVMEDFEITIEK